MTWNDAANGGVRGPADDGPGNRNGWVVRAAGVEDLERIRSIYNHYVEHGTATFEEVPIDAAEMLARWRQVVDCGLPYLVAEPSASGSSVVGFAYASTYRARTAYRFTVESSVYIAPEERGRGAGSALMRPVIEICSRGGYRQLIAVIGDSANHASIGLHQRLGFRHAGTLCDVGFKFDRWLDTVIMQRFLGAEGERVVAV